MSLTSGTRLGAYEVGSSARAAWVRCIAPGIRSSTETYGEVVPELLADKWCEEEGVR